MKNRETNDSASMISFEEIHAIVGYSEDDPVLAFQEVFSRLNDQNHQILYPQIRFLVVCCGLLCRYKNKEIRYIIRKLNSKLLNLIYSNNGNPDFKAFSFLLSISFHFRNCVSIRDFKTAGKDVSFITNIREKMGFPEIDFQTL